MCVYCDVVDVCAVCEFWVSIESFAHMLLFAIPGPSSSQSRFPLSR